MLDNNQQVLMELCYYCYKRNSIEKRRVSAKNKLYRLSQIKEVISAYNGTGTLKDLNRRIEGLNKEIANLPTADPRYKSTKTWLRSLSKDRNAEMTRLHYIKERNKLPRKKWSMSELNIAILKARADYTKAKYDTACHTKKTHKRVLALMKTKLYEMHYDNGVVSGLVKADHRTADDYVRIDKSEFKNYHDQFAANLALEKYILK